MTTTTERDILATTRELAADFATRTEQHDREDSFPYENVEALKASGHYLMMLPKAYGGYETPLPIAANVMRMLGAGDASTALVVTQHHAVVANYSWEALTWGNPVIERFMKEEIASGKVVALLAAAPEFDNRAPTTAHRTDGGWLLRGNKGFGTSSLVADWGTGPFIYTDDEGNRHNVVPLYRTDDPGFRVLDNWDTFGMRSSHSHDLEFNDVFVPDDRVVKVQAQTGPTAKFGSGGMTYSGFGLVFFASLYLGIADAAFAAAKEYLAERRPVGGGPASISNAGLQSFLGEVDQKLREAGAMLNWTTTVHQDPLQWDATTFPDLVCMKDSVTKAAVQIVELCMQAVGGPAYYRRLPLERMYRDVRAGPIHPFNHSATVALLGKNAVAEYLPEQ
jgi:alkylation response protein AidB-like acyl-CoA dehydrogenase